MIPYILILLLLCLGLFYELYLPSARQDMISFQHRAVYFFLVSAVALMTGFRDMIGGYDVYIYAWFFDEIPAIDSLFPWSAGDPSVYFRFEPGYLLLNSVIKFFCADAYFYFFTVALLTYFLIGKAFRRYPFFVFAFFLFFAKFFIVGFVYTRQFIAMGIVWWSLRFLEENRKKCVFGFSVTGNDYSLQCFRRVSDVFSGKPAIFRQIPGHCICCCIGLGCFALYQMGDGFGESFFDAG